MNLFLNDIVYNVDLPYSAFPKHHFQQEIYEANENRNIYIYSWITDGVL